MHSVGLWLSAPRGITNRVLPVLSRLILGAAIVAIGGGCTVLRPVATGVTQHNRAVNDSANKTLLLNILRASDREPKTFTSINSITGKGSSSPSPSFRIGLSSDGSDSLIAPFPLNGSTASFSTKVNDSKEFSQGLFDPVDMAQVMHFWTQGWSKSMLLMLVLDSVRVEVGAYDERHANIEILRKLQEYRERESRAEKGSGTVPAPRMGDPYEFVFQNKPESSLEQVEIFAEALAYFLAQKGIDIREQVLSSVVFDIDGPSQMDKLVSLASRPGFRFEKMDRSQETDAGYRLTRTTPVFHLELPHFVSSVVADQRYQGDVFGEGVKVRAVLRSTEGILHYLGQLHRYQKAEVLRLRSPSGPCKMDGRALFEIETRSADRGRDLVSVKHRGRRYSVPLATREADCPPMTGTVFSFLRQLLGLNRAGSDAPATGIVLVGVGG